jgi:hypothetical protein
VSATPETDAAEFPVMTWSGRDHPLVVRSELARRLERERDDLLTRLTAMEHRMPDELARLERERDEAREQRDRLVEALNKIADLCQMTCMTFETQSFKATEIAIEALAAVTHS